MLRKTNFLQKISFWFPFLRLVRFFRLQKILRKCYFQLVRPPQGIFKIQIEKINAQFFAQKPDQLRSLESDKIGEEKVLKFLISSLKAGEVVYDIGAQLGFYTILLAKKVGEKGKVIAFEPEKESYNILKENLKLNNLNNVEIFQKALGEKEGEGKLFLGQTIGNFSLVKTYEKEIDFQKVEIVQGDEFIKEKKLPRPKLVKIDVEGYEYFVISGLKETLVRPDCQILCCEIHPFLLPEEIGEEKISNLLKSLGFKKQFKIQKRINDYHLWAEK
jgi:FkbM family methyltransferase